jgi:predicted TIM-barrel fold metal-dependent hydrolase
MVIDIHTHAWPDKVSLKAKESLEAHYDVKFCGDPTVKTLLSFMDRNSVDTSVICAVASRPEQVKSINNWLFELNEPRIKYFCALHPDYPQWKEELIRIKQHSPGIKLQPSFQDFFVDDEKAFPVYEEVEKLGLCLLFHSGDELSPQMIVRATPQRLWNVRKRFPGLKMIAAHFGGFRQWEEVRKYLLGKDIYLDTSAFFGYLPDREALELIRSHPAERILFGTDFPIRDQRIDLEYLDKLGIAGEIKEKILSGNARRLLGI